VWLWASLAFSSIARQSYVVDALLKSFMLTPPLASKEPLPRPPMISVYIISEPDP